MDDFDELLRRVQEITGLPGRQAAKVAFEFDPDDIPRPDQIVDKAIELGFEVEKLHGQEKAPDAPMGIGVSMDPAVVLTEVFMHEPRCIPARTDDAGEPLPVELPRWGKAPEELQRFEGLSEIADQLPDDAKAMLLKIDMLDGNVTFWVRDEANDVDRAIGPISLSGYQTESALTEAFDAVAQRMSRVIVADWN